MPRLTAATTLTVATTAVALALTTGPAAAGDGSGPRPTVEAGGERLPAPNPYLALVPDLGAVDWAYWRAELRRDSRAEARDRGRLEEPLTYEEQEPADLLGGNDTQDTAEPIDGFGTGAGEEPGVSVLGSLTEEDVRFRRLPRPDEDNGSIRKAAATQIPSRRPGIVTEGRIGDGPHGRAGTGNGDFDFFKVRVPAGLELVTVMRRTGDDNRLYPGVTYWNEKGRRFGSRHSHRDQVELARELPAGTYYVMAANGHDEIRDPFDSSSGTGAGRQGAYRLSISVRRPDRDFFAVDLDAGDEFGGTVDDARRLEVYDPSGKLVFGSSQDATSIMPENTPMPGGGRAVVDHTAAVDGRYTVAVTTGSGEYQADLEVYETGGEESSAQGTQTLFLDFDGARLNTGIYGFGNVAQLSPMSAFLGRWGLARSDEDALIDEIVAVVTETVQADLAARGGNPDFAVDILNSRDDPDPWEQDNVTRLIVGGTIEESGIPTIGIAQSIDPGNFDREETGLILLDVLSSPKDGRYGNASLNFWMDRSSDRIAFVGQAVGNVTAHEAGHIIGNWHVDQFDGRPNIMDQGGQFRGLYGPGPDDVGGTADDIDVDFGPNMLNPFEGFRGTENTLTRSAFGLSSLVVALLD